MRKREIVEANGVRLCAQRFGHAHEPAILLIHGAAASMDAWDTEFCTRLAEAGRHVIRYDHRDTGESVSYPPGRPGYAMRDLAEDAVGLLDAFGLARAHLVGRSMGGGLALLAALEHPARVASLTLVGTSPGGPGLPPMSRAFLDAIERTGPDWSDRAAALEHVIGMLRIFSGPSRHFDEAALRREIPLGLARTTNVASSQINHFAMDPGPPLRHRLGEIAAPALVIHGDSDPVFPLGHAEALAREIPGARLLVLEGTGHELPPAHYDLVIEHLARHTQGDAS
jgi:pimeloyl-ACP methyl ester carboxylesterase